jgi:hypothetical protein
MQLLNFKLHIQLVHFSQTGHLLSTLKCTHPCFTNHPPQVVPFALSAQEEKLATWMSSRSSRNMTSFSSFLVANSQSAACVGLASTFRIFAL